MSTSAYRAVRQSGIISLPSERTLTDYTHWISPHSGLQVEYVEKLHSMLTEALPSHQHQCALSMDEMKVKSGLVFNKHTGCLVGFVDLGGVNRDIQKITSSEESTLGNLASHVFALMARAVFKPSLCVPVAHYFSSNLKGKISMNVRIHMCMHVHMYVCEYVHDMCGVCGGGGYCVIKFKPGSSVCVAVQHRRKNLPYCLGSNRSSGALRC